MATLLCTYTLLLLSAFFFTSASAMRVTERAALIDSAMAEVQEELHNVRAKAQEVELTVSQKLIREFKKSSKAAQAQGMARLQFEDTVKRAERKIIESNRDVLGQDVKLLAQSYAKELIHTPGSILSEAEIAQLYTYSGCDKYTYSSISCSDDKTTKKYRTADGHCNNQKYPSYGAVGTKMKRLIHPWYEDGISVPRGAHQMKHPSITGGDPFSPPIPSPRIISLRIVEDREIDDPKHALILMQWGQFMDHDLDSMPEYVESSCPHTCEVEEGSEGRCAPFPVPCNDDAITMLDKSCLGFRRSLPACDYDGEYTFRPREHFNAITHFIDGSTLYHHEQATQNRLRTFMGGRLLLEKDYLPAGTSKHSLPQVDSTDDFMACLELPCFLAGDHRANEQTALTVMHTLWAREHNRVAKALLNAHSTCSDEQVFQLARHIVVSQIQKIMYKDYLPIILGEPFYNDSKLGVYDEYDDKVDPSIPNSFATAAYRFGHSQVQPVFPRLDKDGNTITIGNLSLVDAFFDTSHYNSTGTDPVIRGLLKEPARSVDEYLNSILTNKLFANDINSTGVDLASLNIMRGRDHGLPPYLVWRKWAMEVCEFPESNIKIRDPITEIKMYQIYGSLDSVDLFVGGLAEKPMRGGLVGPTFGCIFKQTFLALRDGDYFYYENDQVFTNKQIGEINHFSSLSRVICDNTESDFGEVPLNNAFKLDDKWGKCIDVPKIDLDKWNCLTFDGTGSSKEAPVANTDSVSDDEIVGLLQRVLEKLDAREAEASAANKMADTEEALLSDEELAEKLEALLYKFKK